MDRKGMKCSTYERRLKVKKVLILSTVLLMWSFTIYAQDKIYGVFSNGADEFRENTLTIHRSGYALLEASVTGQVGKWFYDEKSSSLKIKFANPKSNESLIMDFSFDSDKRIYSLVGRESLTRSLSNVSLYHVTDTIPDKVAKGLEEYPRRIKEYQRRWAYEAKAKRLEEEKLERERPEYEKIRQSIVDNPHIILSSELLILGDNPGWRAIGSVLRDHKCVFPEDVLVELLTKLPGSKAYTGAAIFKRPELSSATIQKLYPQAIELGKENRLILNSLAEHPNTPMAIIIDMATPGGLYSGGRSTAGLRLLNYTKNVLAGKVDIYPSLYNELYQLGLSIPTSGYTDYGKDIIGSLARSAATPVDILVQIANYQNEHIQKSVLLNKNTPISILPQFSESKFLRVQAALVSHPDTPNFVLEKLSTDGLSYVKSAALKELRARRRPVKSVDTTKKQAHTSNRSLQIFNIVN